MQYLDFETYSQIGGTLNSTAFSRYIDRACGVIDFATRNRITEMETVPKAAQALCRDLVEYYAGHANAMGAVTSRSQSAGAVSQSESYATADAASMADDVEQMICDYLMSETDDNGTPLLYRGAFE